MYKKDSVINYNKIFLHCFLAIIILVMTYAAVQTAAYAAGNELEASFSVDKDYLNINGSIDDNSMHDMSLIVTECGVDYSDYMSMDAEGKRVSSKYLKQLSTDNSGNFSISVPFSGDDGFYDVIAVSDMGDNLVKKVYYGTGTSINTDIDSYTTTKYAPWLYQYNFTTAAQMQAGYHGGEGGQKGFSMAYSPINTDIVYFGTDTSGVWKSTDGGATWRISSSGLVNNGTVSIFCDKDDVNTVYVAACPNVTGNATYVNNNTGIYVSHDGGASWTMELGYDNGNGIAFYRHHTTGIFGYVGNTLYAVGHNGKLYKKTAYGWNLAYDHQNTINSMTVSGNKIIMSTSDKGIVVYQNGSTTEIKDCFDYNEILDVAVNPVNTNQWFCITKNSLYKSDNSGVDWTFMKNSRNLHSGLNDSFGRMFFGGAKNGNARLYVMLYNISYPLRYSDNYGESFTSMRMDKSLGFMSNKTGYGCEPVAVNPDNPDILIASMDAEIYKSTDGGANFSASSSGYSGLRVMDIAFNKYDDNDMIFSVMDFGAVKAYDSEMGEQFPLVKYKKLTYNNKSASRSVARNPLNPNTILINVGQKENGFIIQKSTDGGETFNDVSNTAGYDTTLIFYNQNNPNVIYAKEIVSYDGGATWEKSQYKIYAVSPINGNIVYGVANNKIYKSTDMGKEWSELYTISDGFQTITPDIEVEDKLYVGFYSGGFRIYENGGYKIVNTSTDGYSMNYIFCIAQDPKNSNHLLAGGVNNKNYEATEGLFESYDRGETWYKVKGVPFGRDIWFVFFHPNRRYAYISTSSGTYVYDYDSFTDGDVIAEVTSNNDSSYKVSVYNVTDSYQPAAVVSALYDNSTRVLNSSSVIDNIRLKPMEIYTRTYSVPKTANESSKLMFWKDTLDLSPYSIIKK